jgi:dTDP-4-dehydrorhamnose 3,5-epimerase
MLSVRCILQRVGAAGPRREGAQAKLCRVIEGEVLDIAVDIRLRWPAFGQGAGVTLSAPSPNLIYVTPGFAQGFLAATDRVDSLYKCSDSYVRDDAHDILWNDPAQNISWGIAAPLVSERDAKLPKLAVVPHELLPRFPPSPK